MLERFRLHNRSGLKADDRPWMAGGVLLRLAPELHRPRLLTTLDTIALEIYCQAVARWRVAERQLAEAGAFVVASSNRPVHLQSQFLLDFFELCPCGASVTALFAPRALVARGSGSRVNGIKRAREKLNATARTKSRLFAFI